MSVPLRIAVIDYGMGNLRSVSKALEHVAPSAQISVTNDPELIAQATHVVFPGVGAMGDCMRELEARSLVDVVRSAAASKPFLGICLGMQMLFEHSEEGDVAGLGILPGRVRRFFGEAGRQCDGLKVPHMGWNTVKQQYSHPVWQGITDDARFYFVHSYYVEPTQLESVMGTTSYPFPFACAVAQANIFAVQFHPEKSQQPGLNLLTNFIHWDGGIHTP